MFTTKTLAAILNGRQYGSEITDEEQRAAADAGLVVVFGYSDDNVELRGAIDAEVSAYNGTIVRLDGSDVLENDCENEDCPHFERAMAQAPFFRARWCAPDAVAAWTFAVSWPHETFRVMEEGDLFCVGVVFALADVAAPRSGQKGGA